MKKKIKVMFDSTESVKEFVDIMGSKKVEAEFIGMNTAVDAKSLMGILTLNLMKPQELILNASDDAAIDSVLSAIDKFIAA